MQSERYPLPFGWTREFDQTSSRPFYVDTKANPPRSIWTHPYEDKEYLKAHPDVREKLDINVLGDSGSNLRPPSFEESQRRHSFGGSSSSGRPQAISVSAADSSKHKDRGFFGKLKDKTIGTKEEREAEKRRRQEEDRRRMEAQQQRIQQMAIARQQLYASQPQYGHGPMIAGPSYGGGFGSHRRRPGGGMGVGLPLLGGLAGGLLLGEALDNDYGGYGGGDFGGGDFGGF